MDHYDSPENDNSPDSSESMDHDDCPENGNCSDLAEIMGLSNGLENDNPSDFLEFLEKGDHADVTIICGGEVFKAHKIILRKRSLFFERTLAPNNGFRATATAVHLDDDPAIVKLLLRFLYHEEYPKGLDDTDPIIHAQLYAAAHFYRVDVSDTLALFYFSAAVARLHRGTVQGKMRLADAIKAAYETTPETNRGLRDLVVSVAMPEMDSLAKSRYFRTAVRGTDFVRDVALARQAKASRETPGDPDLGGWMDSWESDALDAVSAGPGVTVSPGTTWWSTSSIVEALWSLGDYYE